MSFALSVSVRGARRAVIAAAWAAAAWAAVIMFYGAAVIMSYDSAVFHTPSRSGNLG